MGVTEDVIKTAQRERELLQEIQSAIKSIRYGYVQIIIQDSKVVQIDKTEKVRFDKVER